MKDDFSLLMPGHELVIACARKIDAAGTEGLRSHLNSLRIALLLLDAGNHGETAKRLRAREILEGKSGGEKA